MSFDRSIDESAPPIEKLPPFTSVAAFSASLSSGPSKLDVLSAGSGGGPTFVSAGVVDAPAIDFFHEVSESRLWNLPQKNLDLFSDLFRILSFYNGYFFLVGAV